MGKQITIPHKFIPRWYQLNLLRAIDSGIKRAICIYHRRAGKDITLWNILIKKAVEKVGIYYYLLPTYAQAKRIIWDGITNDGMRFIDYIPEQIIQNKNGSELKIILINGSVIQLIGTDNYDSIRGTNPIGCVFSEFAFQNPMAWDVVKPILKLNGGWAVFNTTPQGENHAFDLFEMAKTNETWFTEILNINDTNLLTLDDIQEERREGMPEEMIQQEYYCSFGAGLVGAYYANLLNESRDEGRICNFPVEQGLDVHTAWDLGVNDTTAIWFFQRVSKEIRIVDCFEDSGEGLGYYIEELNKKGYTYGTHYFPHDIKVREFTHGKSREDVLRADYGIKNYEVVPKLGIEDGINAVRKILPYCWFNEAKTKEGLRALKAYQKEYDEKHKVYRNRPLHNWASNYCFVGDTLIKTKRGDIKIENIKDGDYVVTPMGYSRVEFVHKREHIGKMIEIKTTNGKKLVCTPNHKIFTKNGIASADSLRYNDILITYSEAWKYLKLLNLKALFIGFKKAQTTTVAELVESNLNYIGRYGKSIMEKLKEDSKYTIKILINLITQLKTWSVCHPQSIQGFTQIESTSKIMTGTLQEEQRQKSLLLNGKKITQKHGKTHCHWHKKQQKNGIKVNKVENGIQRIAKTLGRKGNGLLKIVKSVVSNIKHRILLGQSTAIKIVSKLHYGEEEDRTLVYDLTVKKHHCYLANEILVSNSDGFRYLATVADIQAKQKKTTRPIKQKYNPLTGKPM